MANRLVALPNTEEEEEFLTDVDEPSPVSWEYDDRWDADAGSRKGYAAEGARTKKQTKTRRWQTCVSTDGYDEETDNSNATEDASKDAAMQQEWRMAVRRQEELSVQKRNEEKTRSHKLAQKGELNSCSNRLGPAGNTGANVGAYMCANTSANMSAYMTANTGANMGARVRVWQMVADGGNQTWKTETGKVRIWQEVADGGNRVWKAMRIRAVHIWANKTGGGTRIQMAKVMEVRIWRVAADGGNLTCRASNEEDRRRRHSCEVWKEEGNRITNEDGGSHKARRSTNVWRVPEWTGSEEDPRWRSAENMVAGRIERWEASLWEEGVVFRRRRWQAPRKVEGGQRTTPPFWLWRRRQKKKKRQEAQPTLSMW
jgi:hypothetical protein